MEDFCDDDSLGKRVKKTSKKKLALARSESENMTVKISPKASKKDLKNSLDF